MTFYPTFTTLYSQVLSLKRTRYILGSELWEENFYELVKRCKSIDDVTGVKNGNDSCPSKLPSQLSWEFGWGKV